MFRAFHNSVWHTAVNLVRSVESGYHIQLYVTHWSLYSSVHTIIMYPDILEYNTRVYTGNWWIVESVFLWRIPVRIPTTRLYSLNPKKATVGHKNFSFCEQTRHKGLIDASCNWLQSTPKNRGQNKFLRKLRAKIQFLRLLFSSLRSISSYNPHTILKNARRGRLKIYIYFYSQKLQVGPGDAACRELQYATKNMARTNFLRKIWRINPGFWAPDQRSYSQIFKIVCTSSKFNTFHAKPVSF